MEIATDALAKFNRVASAASLALPDVSMATRPITGILAITLCFKFPNTALAEVAGYMVHEEPPRERL